MAKYFMRCEVEIEADNIVQANVKAVKVLTEVDEDMDMDVKNYGVMPANEVRK